MSWIASIWSQCWIFSSAWYCLRPMDDKRVKIRQLKVFQCRHQICFDMFWSMIAIPQLGLHKQFLPGDNSFFEELLEGFPNYVLIVIIISTINISISCLNSCFDCGFGFLSRGLPCSQP